VTLLVGCSQSTATSDTASADSSSQQVVLVGDSLAQQVAPYLATMIEPATLVPQFFPGTAPCDWLGKNLGFEAGQVVVVSFAGNSLTPCMSDAGGGFLEGQAVVEKYRTDILDLISKAETVGARVLLVGQPAHAESVGGSEVVDGINQAYVEFADIENLEFVDAGAAVENLDGTFAQSLPCLANEQECDSSGSNPVRSDDGVHFCPGDPPPGPCGDYASGAFRFASAIAAALGVGA
jgi:hypothetical protein